jgi:spore maturation protein CgeB
MRVLVVGPVTPDSMADNLVASLRDAGHDAAGVSPWPGGGRLYGLGALQSHMFEEAARRPRLAARTQGRVVDAAEKHRPELTLVVDHALSAALVPRLRAIGGPVALWFPDALSGIGRETWLTAGYDALFVTDAGLARRYRDLRGVNAHLMPEGCTPRWHRPPAGEVPGDAGLALLMLGSLYLSRFALLRRLTAAGVPLELRGGHVGRTVPREPWLEEVRTGGELEREAKARAFRRAAAVLNDLGTAEGSHLNARLFEAAASGAAVVTEWRDGLPELFEPGSEVHVYRTFDELVELAQALREDPERARAAGDAASARAHAEHTWVHRFDAIVDLLGRG